MRLETLNIHDLDFSGQLIFWRVCRKKEAIEGESKKKEGYVVRSRCSLALHLTLCPGKFVTLN